MKIITDQRKIDRNHKIGTYTMLAGMVVLMAGLFISISQIVTGFQQGVTSNTDPQAQQMLNYATLAMFGGLLLTEISMFFNNRWGKKPYIEEKVNLGLKGLDDRYSLYHHKSPVPTLLVGPAGIWVLNLLYQRGTITADEKRIHQSGVSWFTKTFYQEGISRPEMSAKAQMEELKRFIEKNVPDAAKLPPVEAAVVFTSPMVKVQIDENASPMPAMHVDKLKDFVRRKAKEKQAGGYVVEPLLGALPEE